jgi:hypothetical protein
MTTWPVLRPRWRRDQMSANPVGEEATQKQLAHDAEIGRLFMEAARPGAREPELVAEVDACDSSSPEVESRETAIRSDDYL